MENGMENSRIAGNASINAMINYCLEYITDKDKQKFRSKFRKQYQDNTQVMHTFRELILGAYLGMNGFTIRYEKVVDGKTPDWCILDTKSNLIGIAELVNLEIDLETAIDIKEQVSKKGHASYWADGRADNTYRLYSHIRDKAEAYKDLVGKLEIFYIISAYVDFKLKIYFKEELYPYLFGKDDSIFKQYPEVSAILFFEDDGDKYIFLNALNPMVLRALPFPIGFVTKPRVG
jgi:hypothetical protein